MRLIDAEALKKAFEDTVCIEPMPYAFVKQIIDNAPTVNPYFPISEEVFHQITDAEWEHSDSFWVTTPSGKKVEFEKKRPTGKWIIREYSGPGTGYFDTCRGYVATCSVCKKDTVGGGDFCRNCGADMRKG